MTRDEMLGTCLGHESKHGSRSMPHRETTSCIAWGKLPIGPLPMPVEMAPLAPVSAQLNEFAEPCCVCKGSGVELTGVEHMGAHEFGACMECRGTGLEPRGWEESFREAVTLRANLQLAVSELARANAVIERVGEWENEHADACDLEHEAWAELRTILEGNGA